MNQKKPNILFIMCDQLCASVLETYGGTVDAPNIARLAENGMVFEAAYCQTPICSPSRAAIITGKYPHKNGLVGNIFRLDYPAYYRVRTGPEKEDGITNQDVITEKILHSNGYHTRHIGKWHITSGDEPDCYPQMYREHQEYGREMKETFDRVAELPKEKFLDWYDWKFPVTLDPAFKASTALLPPFCNLENNPYFGHYWYKMGRLDLPLEDTYDYRIGSKATKAILEAETPFMLTASFNMPHDPNVVPSPYYENVDMSRIHAEVSLPCEEIYSHDGTRSILNYAGNAFLTEYLRIYHAAIKLVDDQIGHLLDALEQKGVLDDTCIIFTADHGDMVGRHGMFWKNTHSFYDEVTRVPLIISMPGGKKGRYSKPVELIDIMPTILELCGLEIPADIDGVSLVPILNGGEISKTVALCERLEFEPGEAKRYPHSGDKNEHFMLRDECYKYVIHRYPGHDTRLLYDLEKDPREYENLCGLPEYEKIVAQMHEKLRLRLAETGYILNETKR